MIIKKDMDYAKPSEKEIIIESYKSLIVYISDFCQIKHMNSYKIIIFNSHLQTIDGNDQLMNYKDKILYAKIKENINIKKVENEDNIKYNIFKSIKNLSNRRLYAINHRDDKGNVNRHNKTIFSYAKNSFQTLAMFLFGRKLIHLRRLIPRLDTLVTLPVLSSTSPARLIGRFFRL